MADKKVPLPSKLPVTPQPQPPKPAQPPLRKDYDYARESYDELPDGDPPPKEKK